MLASIMHRDVHCAQRLRVVLVMYGPERMLSAMTSPSASSVLTATCDSARADHLATHPYYTIDLSGTVSCSVSCVQQVHVCGVDGCV